MNANSNERVRAIDYFIYSKSSGSITISKNTKKFFGISEDTNCHIDIIKSHIVGIDIPNFDKQQGIRLNLHVLGLVYILYLLVKFQ